MAQHNVITSIRRSLTIALLLTQIALAAPAFAQSPPPPKPAERPTPPSRDPHTPGYVTAKELPDGSVPPANQDGNFILGPTHPAAAENSGQNPANGTVIEFTMNSSDSKIYPGIARDAGTFGTPDPADPAKLVVTTSHPAPYTRKVAVYVPKQYVAGSVAPFIVGADGPDWLLFSTLDSLIAQHKLPVMIAISIGNGSGDAQGSQRGLEYDTMSGVYAEFVKKEVLPLVETQAHVKLSKDPDGRATMGGSSGGSCALIMAWYHPELYHRVLTYSGTFINQQWPYNPETPHGAWEFHEHLIPNSPAKPIRIWMEVGDRDFLNPNVMRDNMHDWVLTNENMAKVLADKGYHYQFVFARNAGHVDRAVRQQTLGEALEYVWQGYSSTPALSAHDNYFPKGALSSYDRVDTGRARWYSDQLKALNELSLLEAAKDPSLQSYRFVWLRTFHHPVSVRLDIMGDGTGRLAIKMASGAGGYKPGNLIENSSRSLTQKQTDEFLAQVKNVEFWELPSYQADSGFDGSRWMIEGVKGGKYHVVDRWTPSKGPVHDLGVALAFTLAELKIPKDEIY